MKRTRKSVKLAAVVLGISMIAAACGDDDSSSSTEAPSGSEAPSGTDGGGATQEAAMTLTININKDAVWDDGTPITVADLECSWQAYLNTPASLSTVGWDKIISVEQGDSDKQAVVKFSEVYAPYKTLWNGIIKKDAVADCNDVSSDFQTEVPYSGTEWKLDSWSPEQAVLVPNTAFWDDSRTPKAEKVVMVPKADSDTEIASLVSGESDFIFPQAFAGATEALSGENIEYAPGYGTNYEGLYFQQLDGPFADPDFRAAFSKSIDRDEILATIYDPIFPGAPLLQCGLWVPTIGPWCDNTQFENSYDPDGAEQILTDAGWTKNADGLWEKDGTVPEIRWMINAGNSRRESTQALLIPALKEAGFNVVADNCDAACVFQQRLPALDYDLGMYINTAAPDPSVTAIMACDSIPTEENGNQGQNSTGWCNEEASALMVKSDQTIDENARADLIHQIGQYLVDDAVMLPLFQFPNIAAYRTDKLSGPVTDDAANYRAFANNMYAWEPVGDTEIIVGAEQWPECLNPVTECANSSWYVWTANVPVLPWLWFTTAEGTFEPSPVLDGEPTVDIAGGAGGGDTTPTT